MEGSELGLGVGMAKPGYSPPLQQMKEESEKEKEKEKEKEVYFEGNSALLNDSKLLVSPIKPRHQQHTTGPVLMYSGRYHQP